MLLRQTDGLRRSVIADQQIHLNPVTCEILIYGQPKSAECAALHSNAQNGGIIGFRGKDSRQQREIAKFVAGNESVRIVGRAQSTGVRIRNGRIAIQGEIARDLLRIRTICRGIVSPGAPVYPADGADKYCGGGQSPGRNHCDAADFKSVMLRSKLLAEAHLDARRSLRCGSFFSEPEQVEASSQPGILERGAVSAGKGMFRSGGTLSVAQRGVTLGIQSNGFKFFAIHYPLPS
jgi:hypothetical protein